MKILDNIELIDLAIYVKNTLIVTDFHLGYEEALNKQGLMLPRVQFNEIMKRLKKILIRLKNKKIDTIVVNGDLKHEFGSISDQEWRHVLKLLDLFSIYCKNVVLIKGNHDTILSPIAKKRNVKILDNYILEDILISHGDSIPNKKLLNGIKTIIIGHEHPAVSIKGGPRSELFKAFLIGRWKRYDIIVQPSFNLLTEGSDIIKEGILSPFLKGNLKDFEVVVVGDILYKFGKLREI